MILSKTEINRIAREAGSDASAPRSTWSVQIQRLLDVLPDLDFGAKRMTPLAKLCAAGADYGWRELERRAGPELVGDLSAKAKTSLRRNLRRDLEEITRPCLDLELKSFRLAISSLGLTAGRPDPKVIQSLFLGDRPSHRLLSLFRKFPVLVRLWCQLISQWREHVREVLVRFASDRPALSRRFFSKGRVGPIVDAQFGLSDRHHSGRTVARLEFERGSIIYKPRSGAGESEWFSLLARMNRHGFQPKLRAARVLRRKDYCWMEYVRCASTGSEAAARRFYERMGGIIAAAHLLRAVDCHRDNLIASGEHPVLVDVDALWHVSPLTRTESSAELLFRTGFFPNANPGSLQSRSSALAPAPTGTHVARLAGRPLKPGRYRRDLARGFAKAWHCILATRKARQAFARQLRRIRSTERRWMYWATETYAAISHASVQPPVLRLGRERELLIRQRCTRETVSPIVVEAEIRALRELDIPYFVGRSKQSLPLDGGTVPPELIKALYAALLGPR